jgi:nitrogenase-associated protein
MSKVIFYEKPGCINNAKQKALLWAAGHEVKAFNLLKIEWTVELLRSFFGDLPVTEWFNCTAPQIKSGEIVPENLGEETALKLMIADPILIRRPLMQIGNIYTVGFNQKKLDAWIGLKQPSIVFEDLETCPRIP